MLASLRSTSKDIRIGLRMVRNRKKTHPLIVPDNPRSSIKPASATDPNYILLIFKAFLESRL